MFNSHSTATIVSRALHQKVLIIHSLWLCFSLSLSLSLNLSLSFSAFPMVKSRFARSWLPMLSDFSLPMFALIFWYLATAQFVRIIPIIQVHSAYPYGNEFSNITQRYMDLSQELHDIHKSVHRFLVSFFFIRASYTNNIYIALCNTIQSVQK